METHLRSGVVEHVAEVLADVALGERGLGAQVLALAGGEVVDDGDLVAAREQRVDDVRADEPGAAGDDRPHAASASTQTSDQNGPIARVTSGPPKWRATSSGAFEWRARRVRWRRCTSVNPAASTSCFSRRAE